MKDLISPHVVEGSGIVECAAANPNGPSSETDFSSTDFGGSLGWTVEADDEEAQGLHENIIQGHGSCTILSSLRNSWSGSKSIFLQRLWIILRHGGAIDMR
jgi:hypothetical protein